MESLAKFQYAAQQVEQGARFLSAMRDNKGPYAKNSILLEDVLEWEQLYLKAVGELAAEMEVWKNELTR